LISYHLVPVESLDSAGIGHVRRIYEDGFPPHLSSSFESITSGREPGELALALTGDGAPCGFAMLRPLATTGWIFLRYFVVDATQRGRGLGGVLWQQLTSHLREAGYSLLVFDVEDPAEPGCDQEELKIRQRRITFYRRHRASVLPVAGYRTPHSGGDGDGDGEPPPHWTPMVLMAASLSPGGGDPAADPAGVREIVEAVYRHRWSLPVDHPQVGRTLLTKG
jgi:GNAT superfamily N-acetyltransferase